VVLVVVL